MLKAPTPQATPVEHNINDCWNKIGDTTQVKKRCERLTEMIRCQNCPVFIAAGRHLLNRPLSLKYQRELTEIYSSSPSLPPTHSKKLFIFRIGNEWLGLRSPLVHEVVNMSPIHTIPHKSSRVFRGIVNIRGRLEMCISIGGVLHIKPASITHGLSPERLIVVNKAEQSVVFPVSEVMGSVQYNKGDIKPLTTAPSGPKAIYTRGIISIGKRDIALLDDVLLFRILARNLD